MRYVGIWVNDSRFYVCYFNNQDLVTHENRTELISAFFDIFIDKHLQKKDRVIISSSEEIYESISKKMPRRVMSVHFINERFQDIMSFANAALRTENGIFEDYGNARSEISTTRGTDSEDSSNSSNENSDARSEISVTSGSSDEDSGDVDDESSDSNLGMRDTLGLSKSGSDIFDILRRELEYIDISGAHAAPGMRSSVVGTGGEDSSNTDDKNSGNINNENTSDFDDAFSEKRPLSRFSSGFSESASENEGRLYNDFEHLKTFLCRLIGLYNESDTESLKKERVNILNKCCSLKREDFAKTLRCLDFDDVSTLFCIFSDLDIFVNMADRARDLLSDVAKVISPDLLESGKIKPLLCALAKVHLYAKNYDLTDGSLKKLSQEIYEKVSVDHENFCDEIKVLASFVSRKQDYVAEQAEVALQNVSKKIGRKLSGRGKEKEPQGRRTVSRLNNVEDQSHVVEAELADESASKKTDSLIDSTEGVTSPKDRGTTSKLNEDQLPVVGVELVDESTSEKTGFLIDSTEGVTSPKDRGTTSKLNEDQLPVVGVELVDESTSEKTGFLIDSTEDVTSPNGEPLITPHNITDKKKKMPKGKKKKTPKDEIEKILDKIVCGYELSEHYFLKGEDSESKLRGLLERIKSVNYGGLGLEDFREDFQKVFSLVKDDGEIYKVILRTFLSVGFWVNDPREILDFLWNQIPNKEMRRNLIEGDNYYSLSFAFGYIHEDNNENNVLFPEKLLNLARSSFNWTNSETNSIIEKVSLEVSKLFDEFFIILKEDGNKILDRLVKLLVECGNKDEKEQFIKENISSHFDSVSPIKKQARPTRSGGECSQRSLKKLLVNFIKCGDLERTLYNSITGSYDVPLLIAIDEAGINRDVKHLKELLDLYIRKDFKSAFKGALERIRGQRFYIGLAWNARAAFSSFLSACSDDKLKVIRSLLKKAPGRVEHQEGVTHSFTDDTGNHDLMEPEVQPQSNQNSFTAAGSYNQLSKVRFSGDDCNNPHTWACNDGINSYIWKAIKADTGDLAYYMAPINFSFDSEEGIRNIAEYICREKEPFDKPLIVVSNTVTVLASNSTDVNLTGGSHWISWVLLPKKYVILSGEEINNNRYRVFFFDSLGKKSFPEDLKDFLTKGGEFAQETDKGTRKVKLSSFCKKEEIDFLSCNELTGQQMNGSDCGWWAVYYSLMAVYTGGIEFLESLKGKKLSAYPLRCIMELDNDKQISQPGSGNETPQEGIMIQQIGLETGPISESQNEEGNHGVECSDHSYGDSNSPTKGSVGIDKTSWFKNSSLFLVGERLYDFRESSGVIFGVEGYSNNLLASLNSFIKEENKDKMLVYLINKNGDHWVTLVAIHDEKNKIHFFYADSLGKTFDDCYVDGYGKGIIGSANSSKSSDGSASRTGQASDENSGCKVVFFQCPLVPIYEGKKPLGEFLPEFLKGKSHSIEDVSFYQQGDSCNCGIFAIENARVILSKLKQGISDVIQLKGALQKAKHDVNSLRQKYEALQSEDRKAANKSFFDRLSSMLKEFENYGSQQDKQEKLSQMLSEQLEREFNDFNYVVSVLFVQFLLKSQMGASKPEKYLLLSSVDKSVAFLLINSTGGDGAMLLNVTKREECPIPDTKNFPFFNKGLKVVRVECLNQNETPSISLFCNAENKLTTSNDFKFMPIESLNRKVLTTDKELSNHLEILFDQVDRVSKLDLNNDQTRFSFRDDDKNLIKVLLSSDKEGQSTVMKENYTGATCNSSPIIGQKKDSNLMKKRLRLSDGSTEKPQEKKLVQDDKVEPKDAKSSSFPSTTINDPKVGKLMYSSRERCREC